MIVHHISNRQTDLRMFRETRDIVCVIENIRIKTLLQERDRLYEKLVIQLFNAKEQEDKISYCRVYKGEVKLIDSEIKDIEEEIIEGQTFRGLI
jgi:hypothetical protein